MNAQFTQRRKAAKKIIQEFSPLLGGFAPLRDSSAEPDKENSRQAAKTQSAEKLGGFAPLREDDEKALLTFLREQTPALPLAARVPRSLFERGTERV